VVAILGFSKAQVTTSVQHMYAQVAASPSQPFHFPVGRAAAVALGYPAAALEGLPQAVVERFAGVGYPFRADVIRPGDSVLDIGAGSGTDTLIASRLVGDTGSVRALDITPGMLHVLESALGECGITNVETIQADAERIPLPDDSVDVVTSNGALNLVPDKRRAFAEILRVLRPGGRVQVADIVISRPVPLGGRSDPQLWAECVVGAAIDEDYLDLFRYGGFADVQELNSIDYFAQSPSAQTRRIAGTLGARNIEIVARRPADGEVSTPGRAARLARHLRPSRLGRIGGRGLWGAVAALAAVVACYGTLVVVALLSLLGASVVVDEGLWAVTILAAAVLAVVATGINLPRHGRPWPLAAAAAAAALIAYVMFASYNPVVEAIGFAILLGAVALDLYLIYRAECLPER
jgi:ubiquinone/menaquinone biosynthesis C-methylase UbiE